MCVCTCMNICVCIYTHINVQIHAYNLLSPFEFASVYVFRSTVLLLDSRVGRWRIPGDHYFSQSNCDIKHPFIIVKYIIHIITFHPYNSFINMRLLAFLFYIQGDGDIKAIEVLEFFRLNTRLCFRKR